jgi:hypothetical protein
MWFFTPLDGMPRLDHPSGKIHRQEAPGVPYPRPCARWLEGPSSRLRAREGTRGRVPRPRPRSGVALAETCGARTTWRHWRGARRAGLWGPCLTRWGRGRTNPEGRGQAHPDVARLMGWQDVDMQRQGCAVHAVILATAIVQEVRQTCAAEPWPYGVQSLSGRGERTAKERQKPPVGGGANR